VIERLKPGAAEPGDVVDLDGALARIPALFISPSVNGAVSALPPARLSMSCVSMPSSGVLSSARARRCA
jgi:hypothetical protein